jgi:cadmium resistance protein CadD (predicted permease)
MITLISLAIIAFASTNIDDIFVLLGFFSDPAFRRRDVIAGQYVGIGALVFISIIASLLSLVIAPQYIGLMGLAPIALGAKKLYEVMQKKNASEGELERHPAASGILSVAAVTMANGGDNIGIYTPIFATHRAFEIALISIVFAAMTAVWCLIAHRMVHHPALGAPIRRYGYRVVPFGLIGLGFLILYEAGSFKLLN